MEGSCDVGDGGGCSGEPPSQPSPRGGRGNTGCYSFPLWGKWLYRVAIDRLLLLPPLGEGGDGGQRRQFSQTAGNGLQHPFSMDEGRIRGKTQNVKPLRPKKCIALCVVPRLIGMLRTIEFDDQFWLQAGEVSHIRPQRVLAPKLGPQLLAAQTRPQPPLGVGHAPAQGLIQERFFDTLLGCLVGLLGGVALHNPVFRRVGSRLLRQLIPDRFLQV